MENKKNKIYKTIMLIVLTAFITFMLTVFSMYTYYQNNSLLSITNISELKEVKEETEITNIESYLKKVRAVIDRCYLWSDKIDENELKKGAVMGYVDALGDEYTEYVPAQEMKEYTENLTGNFVGIGIYMKADEQSKRVKVYYPIPGSPAESAGIKENDLIISVDGVEYTSDDYDRIADFIKGEDGTTVKIVIERDGERIEKNVKREKINTNPITQKMLNDDIGYLKISSFDEDTFKDFENKLKDLQSKGAKKIVLDVRNNGGGIVKVATNIADSLLEKGQTIISTEDKTGKKEITKAQKDMEFTMPIVLLVNENSASASEILACSLKDNERATIVGTKTYGKGVIQTFLTLADGSGLKITTEQYFTPNGKTIHKEGIEPNEVVELPKELASYGVLKEEEDTQLQKAIEILNKIEN